MKSLPFSKIRKFILITALVILSAGIGYQLGERRVGVTLTPDKQIILNQSPPAQLNVDFALFWDVWQRLHRSWIDASQIDNQKMVWGAISGMVNSLDDPYSVFLPPKENQAFKEDLSGAFEGIGAELGAKDNYVMVVTSLDGTPAQRAGLLSGDLILKVNDEDATGWSVQQAVTKIRGPRGTKVKLNILHENALQPIDITLVRETITVVTVTTWVKSARQIGNIAGLANFPDLASRPGEIAYLKLTRFGDRTNQEWNAAVSALLSAQLADGNLKGLVFDLRNNPGGYLDGSVFIASEFLKRGIVVSQVNADGTRDDYQVNRAGKLLNIPMVVLIDKGSASAAEIVAGALRDYQRATLVGETSFGKGSVQTPEDLSGGAGLHITTGRWLLPKGDSIDKKGVTPDVVVTMDVRESTPEATRDAQLAKAVELLLK